ncbi:MAG: hypothetical protein JKY54_06350 [Flavobacteriales bacterium]|nr:hypothetical protein [Flavobacteriales bacterium]
MRRFFLISIIFCISISGFSQRNGGPKPYFKGTFQLPNPTSNYAFKSLMTGVSNVGLSINFPIGERFHLGIILDHSYFTFDDLAIPEKTNANMRIPGMSLGFGYTVPTSEKLSIEFAMNGGYSSVLISSETCNAITGSKIHTQNALHLEPNMGFYLTSNEYLSFGLTFSYSIYMAGFGPGNVCVQQFSEFRNSDFNGVYQMFSIGFGFKTSLGSKK